jgi:hypothetical protein
MTGDFKKTPIHLVNRIEEDENENQVTNRTFENLDIMTVSEGNSFKK